MAKGKNSKQASEQAYSHLQSRHPRDLGSNQNGDHCTTPANTFRPLEDVVDPRAMRVRVEHSYDPKKGEFKARKVTDDLVHHAQHSTRAGKFVSQTSGARQRYNDKVSVDTANSRMNCCQNPYTAVSPVPVAGKVSQFKRRY